MYVHMYMQCYNYYNYVYYYTHACMHFVLYINLSKRFYKHTVIMHKRYNKMKILDSYVCTATYVNKNYEVMHFKPDAYHAASGFFVQEITTAWVCVST